MQLRELKLNKLTKWYESHGDYDKIAIVIFAIFCGTVVSSLVLAFLVDLFFGSIGTACVLIVTGIVFTVLVLYTVLTWNRI